MTATETTPTTDHSARPLAALVTLVIAAGLVAIVVLFAFSAHNTPSSIDGTTATTSHWVD